MSSTEPGPKPPSAFRFGLGAALVLGAFGAWQTFRKHHELAGAIVAATGIGLVLLTLVMPGLILRLRAGWLVVGGVLGWINTRILLTAVFVLAVTPVALLRRLGKGRGWRMRRGQGGSYLQDAPKRARDHFEHPY